MVGAEYDVVTGSDSRASTTAGCGAGAGIGVVAADAAAQAQNSCFAIECDLDRPVLIAFLRGKDPILAKRVKWYKDPEFGLSRKRGGDVRPHTRGSGLWNNVWLWLVGLLVLLLFWQMALLWR